MPNPRLGSSSVVSVATSLWAGLFAVVFLGCGSSEGDPQSASEWTIEEGALTLEKDLLVSEGENFYFGEIGDLAIGSEGRFYVADNEAYHVKMLSPGGELLETIGAQGEGPGEFERLGEVFYGRSDSLYVLEGVTDRLSIFGPAHEFERRFRIENEEESLGELVPLPDQSGYLGRFTNMQGERQEKNSVRLISRGGEPQDTLFLMRPLQVFVDKRPGIIMSSSIPFGRGPAIDVGPDGYIHAAWSDSLSVEAYDKEGRLHEETKILHQSVPVTDEEREEALTKFPDQVRESVQGEIPATKPAFDHFLVSEKGRLWFGRPTANSDSTAWWVADPDEKRVVTATLPSEVEFLEVRHGYAYGRTTTEKGAPALVRYRVANNRESV